LISVDRAIGESGRSAQEPSRDGAQGLPRTLRIAFGAFPAWEPSIRAKLGPRYAGDFTKLDDADLEAFDAVAPLLKGHYRALARRPDLFGRKFIHPTAEVVALCHDKLALARFLIAKGFGDFTPALRASGPPYPYVWKQRRSGWGRDCHIVMGPDDEARFDLTDQDWFAQALAPGRVEFATHVLRVNGELRYVSTVAYGMDGPMLVHGQNHSPISAQLHRGCPYPALFSDILSALDYQGTACIDYKIVDGKPLIFEINPRFGASLSLDVSAYLDAYLGALDLGAARAS
jgi:hypothetical protein